jgi:hypothetical protein
MRTCNHVIDVERHRYERHLAPVNNEDIGVKYMLSELSEDDWKRTLAKREKERQKSNEIRDVLDAFNGAAIDLFRRIDTNKRDYKKEQLVNLILEIMTELGALRNFTTDALCDISRSFACSVPLIDDKWSVIHGKHTLIKPSVKKTKKNEKDKKDKPANAGAGKAPESDSDDSSDGDW